MPSGLFSTPSAVRSSSPLASPSRVLPWGSVSRNTGGAVAMSVPCLTATLSLYRELPGTSWTELAMIESMLSCLLTRWPSPKFVNAVPTV